MEDNTALAVQAVVDEAAIHRIDRPHPNLFKNYILQSILAGPGMPFLLAYLYFRYHSMRYRFDDEGISMSWGILFRREINLTYSRIQDIHLQSNIFERWLGIARIQVQTASGTSGAEMTIEGLREYEALRDFLYSKMRGTKDASRTRVEAATGADVSELALVLRDVATEIHELRLSLERQEGGASND